ncbi:MAG: hypothetical protein WKF47_11385 [Geodermatophilaceae bacterium]
MIDHQALDQQLVVLDLVVDHPVLVDPGIGGQVPYAGRSVPEPAVEPGRIGVVRCYAEASLSVPA